MKLAHFLLALTVLWSHAVFGGELVIRHVKPESPDDPRHLYYLEVLKLALDQTRATDGPYRLETSNDIMYQQRALKSLETDRGVNVVWTMTTSTRESRFRPVRIPLLKGLLGYRIFLIRKGDQARFSAVRSLDDLRQLTAGQSSDWPDTKILRSNGLKVVGGVSYRGLFSMLKLGRFDYFPRGANEPWAELRTHRGQGLAVEQSLMLEYPAPIYFFVNRQDSQLADRLERGLRLAIADGSFEHLFVTHPSIREVMDRAHIGQRRIFKLDNPLLTPETPLNDRSLWFDPATEAGPIRPPQHPPNGKRQ